MGIDLQCKYTTLFGAATPENPRKYGDLVYRDRHVGRESVPERLERDPLIPES